MPPVSREIYWNVGRGVVLPMYAFVLFTLGIFLYGVYLRVRGYRQGKPLNRLDQLFRRSLRLVRRAFGQLRVLLVRLPGIVHAFLFWAMLVLFLGTLLIMVQVDFTAPLFDLTFLKGTFYEIYSLSLDLAGLAVLVMLIVFSVRRYLLKPAGLATTWQDPLIVGLLTVILLTGFVIEGARMAVTEVNVNPALAVWSPVGLVIGRLLLPLGEPALRGLHKVLWWSHFFLVMGFIAMIPYTKLRHLLATPVNYLFADLREKGSLAPLDLQAPEAVSFGASRVAELSWKDLYDTDACTSCKRCQDRCPAWATGKPLSPMKIVQQIGQVAFQDPGADLIAAVTPEALWACTTCRACEEVCPADIEHVTKIIEMRRHLVLMEGKFPGEEVVPAVNNIEVNGNPFGLPPAARGDWAEGLPVARLGDGSPIDVFYFVGCYASFDKRNQAVAKNFVKICAAAGLRVGILGKEERCCGEPLRKLGNEYLYQQTASANIEKFKAYGVQKIVTTCPHCFNTLKRDYRELGLEVEVEHYTVFLARLVSSGALPLRPQEFEATYHDSCYIGRYQGILDQPRALLNAAGGHITEMEKNRLNSFCCGAGGGRIFAEEKAGRRISVERVRMAQATGAPTLVSNCPFCLTMFEDGIKTGGAEGSLRVRDLAEVLAERIIP
ncbi:MAG TPA: heterodisulfide reductase-related iron-sulfur binding cluster [Anaerolineales bacterium]|nr:heterodisulfide reductase-related iron-sulfur binding cluster [Anaerolineales bacterium]